MIDEVNETLFDETMMTDLTLIPAWKKSVRAIRITKVCAWLIPALLAFGIYTSVFYTVGHIAATWAGIGALVVLIPICCMLADRLALLFELEFAMHVLMSHINHMDEKKLMDYASRIASGELKLYYEDHAIGIKNTRDL